MRAKYLSLIAILLLAAAWPAEDPWKRASETWSLEDVQKILSESPWAKLVYVDATWVKGETHFLQSMPPSCGRPDMHAPMKPPPGWSLDAPTGSVVGFQVTWSSARTVRAALFRLAVICKEADPDQEEFALEREPEGYVISVTAPDMRPFDDLEEDAILANTSLVIKRTKTRIAPERVNIGHGRDRHSVYRLVFQFPKTTNSGEPLIAPDEKELEFVCQAGKTVVKAKFLPPKMVVRNGTDL